MLNSDVLRLWLHKHRLTESDFAVKAGVSLTTISQLLNGRVVPRMSTMNKLSAVTGIPIGKLWISKSAA